MLKPANHHNVCQNDDLLVKILGNPSTLRELVKTADPILNIEGLSLQEALKVNLISA